MLSKNYLILKNIYQKDSIKKLLIFKKKWEDFKLDNLEAVEVLVYLWVNLHNLCWKIQLIDLMTQLKTNNLKLQN